MSKIKIKQLDDYISGENSYSVYIVVESDANYLLKYDIILDNEKTLEEIQECATSDNYISEFQKSLYRQVKTENTDTYRYLLSIWRNIKLNQLDI